MNKKVQDIDEKYIIMFRLIVCLLSWIALSFSIAIYITGAMVNGDINYFFNGISYFTFHTNMFIAIWLTIALIYAKKEEKPKILGPVVRGAITLYITVTFTIFAIVLAPNSPPYTNGVDIFRNIITHYFVPVVFIIDWLITEMENEYEWKYVIYWLSYPIIYVIYSLIRGLIIGWYPYSFIDITKTGIPVYIIVVIGLMLYGIILGCIYIYVNRKVYNKRN